MGTDDYFRGQDEAFARLIGKGADVQRELRNENSETWKGLAQGQSEIAQQERDRAETAEAHLKQVRSAGALALERMEKAEAHLEALTRQASSICRQAFGSDWRESGIANDEMVPIRASGLYTLAQTLSAATKRAVPGERHPLTQTEKPPESVFEEHRKLFERSERAVPGNEKEEI